MEFVADEITDSFYPARWRAAWMYTGFELAHATAYPWRAVAQSVDNTFNTFNDSIHPLASLPMTRAVHAGWRVVDELTKRYAKPEFDIATVDVAGSKVAIEERKVLRRPFCDLLHFSKQSRVTTSKVEPKVLLVAPLSGHFATLVRGTVRAMLAEHDVYLTDWQDARTVPLLAGQFDFHDYIDYLLDFIRYLGPNLHVIAVCQPSVPALAATALLAEEDHICQPQSLTLMGGPVDTACSPTVVNQYATSSDLGWFRRNVISYVPFPHFGAFRPVYPGFLQLAGFLGMNADTHFGAYRDYFEKLVEGDAESAAQHQRFYDEYLAVMDVPAEYFLQTLDLVFHKRSLAQGTLRHRDRLVNCAAITKTTLMTVEGERDDICGLGQTEAAHRLCSNLTEDQRFHYVQPDVGHYGVFNGRRWQTEIQPRIAQMIRAASHLDRSATGKAQSKIRGKRVD